VAAGNVGQLIRERRTSIGLTQRDLAAASGISIGALRDLEQGRTRCPRWGAVAAMANALGMDRYQRAALASTWSGGSPDRDPDDAVPLAGTGITGPGVRIGVLGPLTLEGGTVAGLGPARQRAVLGLLALHGPAGVPRDVIVDVLWPGRTPRSAPAQVQTYISRLRWLLGPGGPVTLAAGCYRLGRGIGLDLADFGQLSRHASAAEAQGQPRLACALYERSLGLWRGDVLADVELLQGYPAAAGITRRRGEVVLGFARAAASLGWQSRALPHVRQLCAREHFNEPAHAHLMTALAAAGQQAAAVEVFWQLKRRLDTELGIRPGPQLAAAHLRILRQQAG